MKLRFSILSLLVAALFAGVGLADELKLRNGRVIQAEEIWETDGVVWYKQGKVIASVIKSDVVSLTRQIQESAPKAAASTSEGTATTSTGGKRKITRLWLKDGAQIDADTAWEESDQIVYRLGQMQTHIERSEVLKVMAGIEILDKVPTVSGEVTLRFSTGNRSLDSLIVYNATKYGVDPLLIYFVMREESGFNHRAVSRVGARGLMQLMPATAARLGVRNIHDPVENVGAGTRYLRSLIDMFGGDINLALAGYNAGEGAVIKYGRRIPPYTETVNYVWRINTAYHRAIRQ